MLFVQIFEYVEQSFSILCSRSCPSVQKIEWIDDNSYAVVFKVSIFFRDDYYRPLTFTVGEDGILCLEHGHK